MDPQVAKAAKVMFYLLSIIGILSILSCLPMFMVDIWDGYDENRWGATGAFLIVIGMFSLCGSMFLYPSIADKK